MSVKRYVILLASGTGSRFGGDIPKQYVKISGRMVLEYTLRACDCGLFDEIVLVVSPPYVESMRQWVGAGGFAVPIRVVEGGSSRQESCLKGLCEITGEGVVIVHNAVQPFVTYKSFVACFEALEHYDAVTCGVNCVYTPLLVNEDHVLVDTPDRSRTYSDFGPEGFRISFLRHVLDVGRSDKVSTDLCGIVFRNKLGAVYVAEGDPDNIKITRKDDLLLAEKILEGRAGLRTP